MKNARIIKEIIDNKVITKSERKLVGASIARLYFKEHTIAGVGAILIARRPQKNSLKHNQTGITLIALVITIILLLILASITINLTLGERGIFNTAKRAVENYKEAEGKEFAELTNFEKKAENVINGIGNKENTFTIIYDLNGGEGKIKSQTKIKGESLTLTNEIPKKDNNSFLGWSSNKNDINPEYLQADNFVIDKNTVLYAIYAPYFYLYNEGEEYMDITGGWSNQEYTWGRVTDSTTSITKNTKNMTINTPVSTGYIIGGTNKSINLSEYKYIKVKGKVTPDRVNVASLNVTTSKNPIQSGLMKITKGEYNYAINNDIYNEYPELVSEGLTYCGDISTLNGEYYIAFCTGDKDSVRKLEIDKVWLEK